MRNLEPMKAGRLSLLLLLGPEQLRIEQATGLDPCRYTPLQGVGCFTGRVSPALQALKNHGIDTNFVSLLFVEKVQFTQNKLPEGFKDFRRIFILTDDGRRFQGFAPVIAKVVYALISQCLNFQEKPSFYSTTMSRSGFHPLAKNSFMNRDRSIRDWSSAAH